MNSIVRYVRYLSDPDDPGGFSLGRIGPITEGHGRAPARDPDCSCSSAVASRRRMSANAEQRATRQIAVALAVITTVAALGLAVALRTRRPDASSRASCSRSRSAASVSRSSSTARKLLPQGPFTEEREPLESSPEDIEGFARDFDRRLRRRRRGRRRGSASPALPRSGCSARPPARSGSPRCSPSRRSVRVRATRCSSRSGARAHASSTSRASR